MVFAGDTIENYTNYSSKNLPDFAVMEQSYLNNYTLEYKVASSKYESSVSVKKDNPSYSFFLKREQFLGDRTQREELKIR